MHRAPFRVARWLPAYALAAALISHSVGVRGQAPLRSRPVVFEGARLIIGTAGPSIESGAFVVNAGLITAVGPMGSVARPPGADIIDLRGKTVIPGLVDTHSHLGYTNVRTGVTSAGSYTRENLIDHLQRYAYYGIAATLSMGLDPGDLAFELRARPTPRAARFLTAGRGLAMPNAGPNAQHWRDAAYGVTTEADARVRVRELAAARVDVVKIWVDDRNRTVTPLPPSLYIPIIDEAHRHGLRVIAHEYYLADAKALLRAGVDGFAHGIRDLEIDDELLTLWRARPHVFLIPNLPDTAPSPEDLEWLAETIPPAQIESMRKTAVANPPRPRLFEAQARSLARLHAAGVRIAFGTDAGVGAPYGYSAHAELADMVAAGLTPAHAIVAATSTSAEVLGLKELGAIAVGKGADFVVLNANPLEDIRRTRQIADVYLRGERVDRAALRNSWTQ